MSGQTRRYLDLPLKFFKNSGLSSSSRLSSKILSRCFFLPITFALVYLVIRKFGEKNTDILLLAELFETLTTCAHLLSRKYVMYMHDDLLKEIIAERFKYFWNYDGFGKKFGLTLQFKMKVCSYIVRIVVSGGFVTIVLFCLTTIVDKSKKVPLICWTPEDELWTGVIYCFEVLVLLEILYMLLTLDCFYLLICTDFRIQLILLRKSISLINFTHKNHEKSLQNFIRYTIHHKFLLKFHKKINTVFSVYFVVLYLVTVACASMHSYIILFKSPSVGDTVKSIFYLTGMLFQVGLYFIITSNIEIEAEKLTEEIYNVNWQNNPNLKTRKHILFMLMRSQKPLCISGGGMLHINRNEYVGICRLAYSIATILGGMT